MNLTTKDLVTTLLAVATVGLYYAMSTGITLPIITEYRGAILALAVMGIMMCAFSGGATRGTDMFITIASILGVAALVVIIYGLITGAKIAFMILTAVIIALWFVSTLHHVIQVK